MKPETLRNLYESELKRAVRLVPDTDPRTEEYSRLLFAIGELGYRLQSEIINAEDDIPCEPAEEPKTAAVEDITAPAPAEDRPVVDTDDIKGETEYVDPESLRAELADAKKKGINISELISSLGAANFSGLRDDQNKLRQLKALMEKALEAL